jgi:hypothetical protein
MLPLSESSRVKEGVWDRFWACKTPFARIKNERRISSRMIKRIKWSYKLEEILEERKILSENSLRAE